MKKIIIRRWIIIKICIIDGNNKACAKNGLVKFFYIRNRLVKIDCIRKKLIKFNIRIGRNEYLLIKSEFF